jgi:hypothetical protein
LNIYRKAGKTAASVQGMGYYMKMSGGVKRESSEWKILQFFQLIIPVIIKCQKNCITVPLQEILSLSA